VGQNFLLLTNHTTSTAVIKRNPAKDSTKSKVSMEALGFGSRSENPIGNFSGVILSHVPSHLACMYLCFLHGPKCIFFSFMHFFAAQHKILIRLRNLSDFPTNISGNRLINLLYSSLALAISNSARKFNSINTLTSPFFGFDLSKTSKKVCSPEKLIIFQI
jgi:hypothetical protein